MSNTKKCARTGIVYIHIHYFTGGNEMVSNNAALLLNPKYVHADGCYSKEKGKEHARRGS